MVVIEKNLSSQELDYNSSFLSRKLTTHNLNHTGISNAIKELK